MQRLTIATVILLAACAGSGSTTSTIVRPEQTVRVVNDAGGTTALTTASTTGARVGTVPRPIASVWSDLPVVLRSVGIDVTHVDANQMVAGNPGFKVRRRLADTPLTRILDCGRSQDGPNADIYEVTMAVTTRLTPDEDGNTTVSTVIEATARPLQFAGSSVSCTSRGQLENRILAGLVI